ncbi:serine/threonine-protein kinase ULK4 isoform X1 [Hydra vulgaris]|uniref:serine/threonine-protein kinase ULK4 isoform X1 n=2 Tax=Hydra vulgaris TaxID=6087 RepID=UPI001F5FB92D|nr:serine/threonine-protein kinase ULK4 isoform X1 [Hydra vulgaris]
MENFVLYDEIGKGNQRVVYKGRRKGTIKYVAIHCIEKSKRNQLQNSVRISHQLNHPNIVHFYEWYETSNHFWLVVELCTGGSLQTVLQQDIVLPEKTIKSFGKDLVSGLLYLHSLDIVYCDLSPQKIILDSNGTLKYSNFSLSCLRGEDFDETIKMSSVSYKAPEVIDGHLVSLEADLWSLGCLLYQMFTGNTPFHASSYEKICEKIRSQTVVYPIQNLNGGSIKATENLYTLIAGLLQKDPTKRIDWFELCLHPFWEGELSHLTDIVEHLKTSQQLQDSLCNDSSQLETLNANLDLSQSCIENDSLLSHKSFHQDFDALGNVLDIPPEEKLNLLSLEPDNNFNIAKGTYLLSKNDDELDELNAASDNINTNDLDQINTQNILESSMENSKVVIDLLKSNSTTLKQSDGFIGLNLNVIDHLYHSSDLTVTPIAENSKLLKLSLLKWDVSSLGFNTVSLQVLQDSSKDYLKQYLNVVFDTFLKFHKSQEKVGIRSKLNLLAYLIAIAKVKEISNLILEEHYQQYLLKELKHSQNIEVKIRIGRLLGVIGSCSSYISPSFNMSEIFNISADQIKQNFRLSHIKQSFLPVIGEFLFFAATQEETENKVLHQWEPSGAVFTIINKCLQQSDDHVARHIAAKIIENVTTTTGRYCKKFLTNEVGLGLWNLYSHATTDIEKATAASALAHLSMHSPTIMQHVSDRAGFNVFQEALFTGVLQSQISFVTIFVTLLSSSIHFKRIMQEDGFLRRIIQNLDSPSFILQAKIYILLCEMISRSHETLLNSCELKLIGHLEKNARKAATSEHNETSEYAHKCLGVLANTIVTILPSVFEGILHILEVVTGRHHPNPAQTKQLRSHLPLMTIALHLVTSSLFRKKIIKSIDFIQYIGKILQMVNKIGIGEINLSGASIVTLAENLTSDVFSVVEAIGQHPLILLENISDIVNHILPMLILFRKSDDGNLRMLSCRLFTNIASIYLEKEDDATPRQTNVDILIKMIENTFVNEIEDFLLDQDPLPSYCLRLVLLCAERSPHVINGMLKEKVISTLLHILETHQNETGNSTLLNAIGLLNLFIMKKELDFSWLCNLGLIEYLTSAFMEVASSKEDDTSLLLQLLDTIQQIYKKIETAVKSVLLNKYQSSSNKDLSLEKNNVEKLLKQSKGLCELNGIFVNLLVFDDDDIKEWACRCLYLSAELFGGSNDSWFTNNNVVIFFQAILSSNRKRQKILLRVIKRYVTSNAALKDKFKSSFNEIQPILENLMRIEPRDSDDKFVKDVSNDLLKIFFT